MSTPTLTSHAPESRGQPIRIGGLGLPAALALPARAVGLVIAPATGQGTPEIGRQIRLGLHLNRLGLGTLLFDPAPPGDPAASQVLELARLCAQVTHTLRWLQDQIGLRHLPIGLLGLRRGAGAALLAAAREPGRIQALVTQGGRPDLAGAQLARVQAPTLMLLDGSNPDELMRGQQASQTLSGPRQLEVLTPSPNESQDPEHLDGALRLAGQWFLNHLAAAERPCTGQPPTDATPCRQPGS